jgi:hypothetical protein
MSGVHGCPYCSSLRFTGYFKYVVTPPELVVGYNECKSCGKYSEYREAESGKNFELPDDKSVTPNRHSVE